MLDCGLNSELFAFLDKLRSLLKPDVLRLKEEVATFARKNADITGVLWEDGFTMEELYNVYNQSLGVLVSALRSI